MIRLPLWQNAPVILLQRTTWFVLDLCCPPMPFADTPISSVVAGHQTKAELGYFGSRAL